MILDTDEDGLPDRDDPCPRDAGPSGGDLDGDTIPDLCDPDRDGDGLTSAGGDCEDSDSERWFPPGEVRDLRISDSGGAVAFRWEGQEASSGPAVRYDIATGLLGPGPWDPLDAYGGSACLLSGVAGTGAVVPVGGSAWFLVRAVFPEPSGCPPGTYGESGLSYAG